MITRVPASRRARHRQTRGSLMLSSMLIAVSVAVGLAGYLNLSRNALKLSQRTYYLNAAANLAEAGLEEAVYSYRLMDSGTAILTAWTSWTLSSGKATLTLPTFNLGNNAVGVVKVYVDGYDGTLSLPTVVSQARITPIDGSPPVVKTFKVSMKKRGAYNAAIITANSLSLGANSVVDSFNSNPTGVSGATRLLYPGEGATSAGHIVALAGTLSLGNGALVKGNALLGPGVTAPSASQVTGSIVTNYTGTYPTPTFPTFNGFTGNYLLLSIPATLPRASDTPAADGRYYYWALLDTLDATTITGGKNVTIFCAAMSGGLVLGTDATCIVWTGNVTTTGAAGFTNPNWAGALQIYSLGSLSLGHSGDTRACVYAPLSTVTLNGGGSTKTFTGSIIAYNVSTSGNWSIHYDTSLANVSTQVGTGWSMTKWYDLQGTTEALSLATVTGGFLL